MTFFHPIWYSTLQVQYLWSTFIQHYVGVKNVCVVFTLRSVLSVNLGYNLYIYVHFRDLNAFMCVLCNFLASQQWLEVVSSFTSQENVLEWDFFLLFILKVKSQTRKKFRPSKREIWSNCGNVLVDLSGSTLNSKQVWNSFYVVCLKVSLTCSKSDSSWNTCFCVGFNIWSCLICFSKCGWWK